MYSPKSNKSPKLVLTNPKYTTLADTPVSNAAETGLVRPKSLVYTSVPNSPRLNEYNTEFNTPRYNLLSTNSPRIPVSNIQTENLPAVYTPGIDLSDELYSPEAKTSMSFSTDSSLIDTDGIVEVELSKLGYVPMQKMMINENNTKQCAYIFAYDKFGNPLLIELDDPGVVTESKDDLTMIKSNVGSVVNYSAKVGELECLKTEGCNLAYICDSKNGMCVLENDEAGRVVESNFEFVKKFSEKDVIIDDDPVAYPVIHLSDIRANPTLVLNIVHKATKKLRNNAYKFATSELIETRNKLQALITNFNKFIDIRSREERRLMDSIKILEKYAAAYEKKCMSASPLNQIEIQKRKEVQSNLTVRSTKFNELLNTIKTVSNLGSQIELLNNSVVDTTEYLVEEMTHIDKAFIL
jgi:hypothetical protein